MFRLSRAALVLAVAVGYGSTLAAQTLTFSRQDYASREGARAVLSADFNRDGRPDLAHANTGRNTVAILLGGDGGSLLEAFDILVGAGPFDLTTGDYNEDGIADLAVANADGHSISLLTGRGDGTFTRGSDLPAPGEPRGIATGDVDGNGTADLIYSTYEGGAIRTLLGDGAGSFTSGPGDAGAASHPQGLALGDFNRDGRLDIAVATVSATGLRVLYGLGGARFTARALTGGSSLNVARAADLNGDGWLDIAAASTATARMVIYLGGPTGLTRSATYTTGTSPRGLVIADVNGDGWLDVATADRQNSSISVFRADRAHPGFFLARMTVPAGPGSRSVTAADFNGDGLLDLATGNQDAASVTVLMNTTALARAGFGFSHIELGTPLHQWGGTDEVWPADFNRDGRPDFAVIGDNQMRVAVLLTNGATVTLPTQGIDRFAVADVNGDGTEDVVAVVGVVHVFTYLGDGRGGFIASPMTALPEAVVAMSIGDADADGTPDLAMLGGFGNGPVWLMHGNGDGTFALAVTAGVVGSGPSLTMGDIDRDGRLDVAALLWDGRVAILWGDRGGLAPGPVIPFFNDPLDFIGNPSRIVLADLNRDGYLDILASGPTSTLAEHTHIGIALGGPEGPAVPTFLDGTQVSWAFAIGDVTMDGRPDIVTGAGEVFAGHGDGTFAAPEAFDYFGTDVRVLDVTHDGLPDIVFAASRGAAGVLVNRRGDRNRSPVVSAGPDRTVAFADQWSDGGVIVAASAADPDSHALSVEWRDGSGAVLATTSSFAPPRQGGGRYTYTFVARDGRGGESTDTMILTMTPMKEIVLHVGGASSSGSWQFVNDATAAGGVRAYNTNLGLAKTAVPSPAPDDQITIRFIADPSQSYKLWIRLKADRNNWANDSVWVQFYGATDGAGHGVYSPGTTSGLAVNLEECSGCGVSVWGWEDDGWGAVNRNGVLLRFYAAGEFAVVVQRREDGVSIDQIVLSSEKYLTVRPGAAKNDTTILPQTYVAR